MANIIKDHPTNSHPFAVSLLSSDDNTTSGIAHRVLTENGHNNVLFEQAYAVMRKAAFGAEKQRNKVVVDFGKLICISKKI